MGGPTSDVSILKTVNKESTMYKLLAAKPADPLAENEFIVDIYAVPVAHRATLIEKGHYEQLTPIE